MSGPIINVDDTTVTITGAESEDAWADWDMSPARRAMVDWVRRHGLDPYRMVLPCLIVRDVAMCRVSCDAYIDVDDGGRWVVDEAAEPDELGVRPPKRRWVVVQLEVAPLPWPIEVRAEAQP